MKKLICAVTVLAVLTAQAATINVDAVNCPGPGNGSVAEPYCSIQTAIDNALDTDEVVVAPGTYVETINFLGKAIWLHSSGGPQVTTIDAQQTGTVVTCNSGEGSETVLQGFTITGGGSASDCCILNGTQGCDDPECQTIVCNLDPFCCDTGWDWGCVNLATEECDLGCDSRGMLNFQSSPTVTDCTFIGNSTAANGGGIFNDSASPMVTDCTFSGNTARYGGGMYNQNKSSPTMTSCAFSGNSAANQGGGMYNDGSSPTMIDCTFSGNTTENGGGMYNYSSNPTLTDCSFSGNTAIWAGGLSNNVFSSPTVTNCSFSDNTATWAGGMSNGFNCNPAVTNCTFSGNMAEDDGGGMYNYDDASPILTDCTFIGNAACCEGGGIVTYEGSLTVINCTFSENTAFWGGGMYIFDGNLTVTDCTFDGNTAGDGGGLYNYGGNPTVTNCTFSGNLATYHGGGGMYNYITGDPTVTNCTFDGNSAIGAVFPYGGGMYNDSNSSPTVTNCMFSGNMADNGGGMFNNLGNSPTVTDCTFTGNSAANGRALACDFGASDVTLTNCILWNGGNEIWNNDGSSIDLSYGNVQGGFPGIGNIDVDPLFVDPNNGDFRLSAGSPCIDAGNNWGVSSDTADVDDDGDVRELTPLDLDGNPRFADDPATTDSGCGVPVIVDMGAYEFQGTPVPNARYLGDLDADRVVGIVDFLALLANWGPCEPGCCIADLDIDGDVGISDFLILLGNWG